MSTELTCPMCGLVVTRADQPLTTHDPGGVETRDADGVRVYCPGLYGR
jgi:hypothetical protein